MEIKDLTDDQLREELAKREAEAKEAAIPKMLDSPDLTLLW